MTEQLNALAEFLAGETLHAVTIEDDAIYVNYDYLRAVVIEHDPLRLDADAWSIEAYEWDVTGGVRDSMLMGVVQQQWIAPIVNAFVGGYEATRLRVVK